MEDISLEDVDFSDLEEKYAVEDVGTFDKYVVLDGAPIAPESKLAILTKVLTKFLSSAGKVTNFYMPLEEGKTQGFAFVEYETVQAVNKAIKQLDGKKLDVKHTLLLNRLTDVEKYAVAGAVPAAFEEPELPPFQETGYLKSWLLDERGRDQFALHKGDVVGVFWNKKNHQLEPVVEPRSNWTNGFIKFSPKGSYVFSVHPQGVQAWGGDDFGRLKRFLHPNVRLIDFSPNEKYLVTLSPEPIVLPPEDHPSRKAFPFGPESEGHKLVIWDIATGLPVRTFGLPPNLEQRKEMIWPLLKWSADEKYVARIGPNALAVYDVGRNFEILDKKPIRIEEIVDFEWAPAPVALANARKEDPPSYLLAYWTPELANQSARVVLMDIPGKRVLRSINLFQVSDVKIHWQDKSEYLAVKVDRHTKSKKTIFTNLELIKIREKDVPVEKVELKDRIVNFAWEPKSDRFVAISRPEIIGSNPAAIRNSVLFYATDVNKHKWVNFKTIEGKLSNSISFSPRGRFVVIGTLGSSSNGLEFYDLDYAGEKKARDAAENVDANVRLLNTQEYSGVTDMEWESSGRYFAAWSSFWRHKIENGYKIFDFAGHLIREELLDEFKSFAWRPRPESLLTNNDKKRVRKNLREFSAQFEEIDAMEESAALREIILERRRLLEEWNTWRASIENNKDKYGIVDSVDQNETEIIEEIKEEIIEEKEEIVE